MAQEEVERIVVRMPRYYNNFVESAKPPLRNMFVIQGGFIICPYWLKK